MENIRLDYVADEDTPNPLASAWLLPLEEQSDEVLSNAIDRVLQEGQKVLPPDVLAKSPKSYPDNGYAFGYEFCTKKEFLDALADPDEERFIDLIRGAFDALAKLTPVMDEVLGVLKQEA